jgi:hypothetical protein
MPLVSGGHPPDTIGGCAATATRHVPAFREFSGGYDWCRQVCET